MSGLGRVGQTFRAFTGRLSEGLRGAFRNARPINSNETPATNQLVKGRPDPTPNTSSPIFSRLLNYISPNKGSVENSSIDTEITQKQNDLAQSLVTKVVDNKSLLELVALAKKEPASFKQTLIEKVGEDFDTALQENNNERLALMHQLLHSLQNEPSPQSEMMAKGLVLSISSLTTMYQVLDSLEGEKDLSFVNAVVQEAKQEAAREKKSGNKELAAYLTFFAESLEKNHKL